MTLARAYVAGLIPHSRTLSMTIQIGDRIPDATLTTPTADGPNDLEPAALHVEPRLAPFRDALGDDTGEVPVLAGSGSTWFVPGAHPGPGRVVARTVPTFAP